MKHIDLNEQVANVSLLWKQEKELKAELASERAKNDSQYRQEVQAKLNEVKELLSEADDDGGWDID